MNTSDVVDRTENVDFEEIKEEQLKLRVETALREVERLKIRICHLTKHLDRISTSLTIEQLEKDLGVISIESQERKEKSDN